MKLRKFVRLATIGEVILAMGVLRSAQAEERNRNQVSVTYRVNCRDRDTGADRAYSTVTATGWTRRAALAQISRMIETNDLCQANGDQTRITVPGSGRLLN